MVSRFIVFVLLVGCSSYQAPLDDRTSAQTTIDVVTRNTPGVVEGGIPRGSRYRVLPGDTLFGIAFQFDLDPERLAAANNIDVFQTLNADRVLVLNEADPRAKTVVAAQTKSPVRTSTASNASEKSKPKKTAPTSSSSTSASRVNKPSNGPISWQWPVAGRVLEGFSSRQRFSRSLRIAGNEGDPVRAAAAGKVVYAGDGLVGLGNLVLIRHDATWLSAYGHNQSLRVQVNQEVRAGEQIAALGSTGTDRPKLHFELRKNGEPVDPSSVLPDR